MLQARAVSSHSASTGRIIEAGLWGNRVVLETRKTFPPRSEQRDIRTNESFKYTQPSLHWVRGVRDLRADGSASCQGRTGFPEKEHIMYSSWPSPELCQRARRNEHHQHCSGGSADPPGCRGGEGRSDCLGIEFLVAARSISLGKFFLFLPLHICR